MTQKAVKSEPFKWNRPPPESNGADMPGTLAEWLEDADVLRWAVRNWGPPKGIEGRPIARWIDNLQRAGTGMSLQVGTVACNPALSVIADFYGARQLAWSIRVLGCNPRANIDSSIFSREVCTVDPTLYLPAGVSAFLLAARCLHLADGHVHLAGGTNSTKDPSKKYDVRWTSTRAAVFEQKDRSFLLALNEDAASLAKKGAERCIAASEQLKNHRGKLKIGCWGAITRASTALEVKELFPAALMNALKRAPDDIALDGAMATIIGYDTIPAGNNQVAAVPISLSTFVQSSSSFVPPSDPIWTVLRRVFVPPFPSR